MSVVISTEARGGVEIHLSRSHVPRAINVLIIAVDAFEVYRACHIIADETQRVATFIEPVRCADHRWATFGRVVA